MLLWIPRGIYFKTVSKYAFKTVITWFPRVTTVGSPSKKASQKNTLEFVTNAPLLPCKHRVAGTETKGGPLKRPSWSTTVPMPHARLLLLPFLLRCGASKTLLVHLQHACQTKPEMQATATLLALTDPRGDKYVCLLLCEQSWWWKGNRSDC